MYIPIVMSDNESQIDPDERLENESLLESTLHRLLSSLLGYMCVSFCLLHLEGLIQL